VCITGLGANRNCTWLGPDVDPRLRYSNDSELTVLRRICAFNSPRCLHSEERLTQATAPVGSDDRHWGALVNECVLTEGGAGLRFSWNPNCW
jgi:hypothetical protein